ncbi:DUF580-domain-containing protein [Polyplosphaeria fusca]|uniref:Protein PNS1 n=1 Tax=Polyplosphaeria fusca TaxID=682080 RepID=A0A9P4UYR1_9PLEO|nr:DUF580-domain-containing protein [Polyplosphaeria fusca]
MAQRGEASDYYNSGAYQMDQGPKFQQPPPQYGQTHAPPQGPPPNAHHGYGPPQHGEKNDFQQVFKVEGPKWNDIWAGLLLTSVQFIAVFLGFAAVSGITIQGYSHTISFQGGIYGSRNDFGLDTNTIVLFAFVLIISIVLSYAYMWMARVFTKQLIWITGILNIVFGFVTAIYMLSRKYWSGGIVFLLFSIFYVICFISWIPRIPFSTLMLRTAIDVSKKFGHVYVVSFIGGVLAAAFGAWYSVTLVAVYVKYSPGNNPACNTGAGGCGSGKVIGLIAFITFAMYWISEWLKNTIHTTISGVYGSWYFCAHNFPKNATRGAFKRSMTYSFGSISLGSLLVAIINCLRQICSIAQQSAAADGNIIGTIFFCVLGCIIGFIDWAVQFLNRYAFSHIALYGKSYIAAAKDTWKMIKNRGIDALVNECLIGPVLSMGATFIGYACALLAYLYLIFTAPAYNADGAYTPVVVAFAFLIGLQICNTFTTPLSSGVDTIFVAMAWDPEVMIRDHPDLYQQMVAVYPQVQQAIHA